MPQILKVPELKQAFQIDCGNCGVTFEVDINELKDPVNPGGSGAGKAHCQCPKCGAKCFIFLNFAEYDYLVKKLVRDQISQPNNQPDSSVPGNEG